MAVGRQLSIKFDIEGYAQATQAIQGAGKAFESALKSAQNAAAKAKESLKTTSGANDAKGMADAQRQLEAATKASNRAIAASFRELGIKSSESINLLRAQAVSAFEAIKASGTASARDIAIAQQALNAKLKDLETQLKGTKDGFKDFGQGIAFAATTAAVNAISSALTNLASIAKGSVQEFINFDDAIRAFGVTSQSSEKQIALVREEVERLGIATSKSPQQVAQMAVELARAGFTAEETRAALEGIVRASEATGENLSTVGDIIGKTLRQFKLDASESGRVADLLVQTANASNTSISGLGESLKYVGTTAATSNQKLEDVLAVLGLMGNAGLQGGQGGRNFAAALEKVSLASAGATDELIVTSKGMKTAGEAVKALGVDFRDAQGNLRPFMELLPEIQSKLKTLSREDQDVIFKVLFGTEGGRAIRATLQATGKDVDYLVGKIQNASGVAVESGEKMNAGLGGSLRLLDGSVKALQTRIASEFAPVIQASINQTIEVFNSLIKSSNSVVAAILGIAATVSVIVTINAIQAAIAALSAVLTNAGGVAALFKTALLALSSPANVAAIAIGVTIGALANFVLSARQARSEALALGDALDVLATKNNRTALTDLERQEANAKDQLRQVDQNLTIIQREIQNYNPIMAGFGGKTMDVLQRDLREGLRQRADIQQGLSKVGSTRAKIEDNIFKSQVYGPPAPERRTVAPAPVAPSASGGSSRSGGGSDRTSRKAEQEYYQFSVARPTGGVVTSGYGNRRAPTRGASTFHDGIDLNAPTGTNIAAPLPGKVIEAGFDRRGGGNYVKIQTVDQLGRKIENTFMHLSKILVGMNELVKQGDTIGLSGSTGTSTGAHLHWRTRINGQSVNPTEFEKMKFMLPASGGKPSDYLRSQSKSQPTEKQQLISGIIALAQRQGVDAEGLIKSMLLETGGTLSPRAHGNGAVGLIGFTRDNQKELGTTLQQLGKMTAQQQLPYVEKYLQIHARGQKLDNFQKVASTIYGGNPNVAPSAKPDGKLSLKTYMERAESRYGDKARSLITDANQPLGEQLQAQAEIKQEQQSQAELARKELLEQRKTEVERLATAERAKITEEADKGIYELKLRSLNTTDEVQKQAIEQDIKMQELLNQALLKQFDLTIKKQNIEDEITILDRDRASLSTDESKRLEDLLYQRQQITEEIKSANAESERAVSLQQYEVEAAKKQAIAQLRESLVPMISEIAQLGLNEAQKALQQFDGDIINKTNELIAKIEQANAIGDTQSADAANQALVELGSYHKSYLDGKVKELELQQQLNQLSGDELEKFKLLSDLQQQYTTKRQELEAILSEAIKNNYVEQSASLESLITRLDSWNVEQKQAIADRFNEMQQLYISVTGAARNSLEGFFSDLFTGTQSLGDALNGLFKSILTSIGQIAAKNITSSIFQSLGFGFAEGGIVPGIKMGGDRVPAMLSPGEVVINRRATSDVGAAFLNSLNVRSPRLSFEGAGNRGQGTSKSATVVVNVTTPDANSFRRSETQIGRDAGEMYRRSVQRNG